MCAPRCCARSTFGLIISGLESAVHGGVPPIAAALVGGGALVGVVFVRRELTSKIPMLPVDLLMRPVVAWSALGGLAVFIASMMVMVSLPFRLQQHHGLPARSARCSRPGRWRSC